MHVSGLLAEKENEDGTADENIRLLKVPDAFSVKTSVHVYRLFERYGFEGFFGRSDVMSILDLQSSRASKLISIMLKSGVIASVAGHGKGKYRFVARM